jgi:hypothetical protein
MDRKELYINEEEELFGIEAVSLVLEPAIERDFIALQAEQWVMAKASNDDKQLLIGPALIPNKDIVRVNGAGEKYMVFFTPETVEQAAHLFMKQARTASTTVDHERPADEVFIFESWTIENSKTDKAALYGFDDLPVGTWMVAVKVENGDLWKRVKAGELRGFSIEGFFSDRLINKVETPKIDEMSILTQIRELLAKTNLYAEDQLQDGTKIVTEAEAFEPGVIVNVLDEEGNPSPAPAGEHTLMNGTIIVVGEGGRLESIGQNTEEEPAPAAEELAEAKKEEEDEEAEKRMGDYRKRIKKAFADIDVPAPAADLLVEAVVEVVDQIVQEAVEPAVEEVVEEVVEEKVEEAVEKAELSAAVTELAKHLTSQVQTISERLSKLEEAPAAEFTHTPAKAEKTEKNGRY